MPEIIQLNNKKGFNLQKFSKSLNGLDAVICDNRTKWGNPFSFRQGFGSYSGYYFITMNGADYIDENGELILTKTKEAAILETIILYKEMIEYNDEQSKNNKEIFLTSKNIKKYLKGKNLACWCKKNEFSHCNILLKIANK